MSLLYQLKKGFTRRSQGDEIGLAGNNILAEISKDRTIYTDSGTQVEVEGQSHAAYELERSYAVETIDLSSVKKLGVTTPQEKVEKVEVKPTEGKVDREPQLELDLGDSHRGWMESFVLSEPISVLSLSQHAKASLTSAGMTTLKDIIGIHFEEFVLLKGLGQVHIKEVKEKLNLYLKGRNLSRPKRIDPVALVRGALQGVSNVQLAHLFKKFGCEEFIKLTPHERNEFNRISPVKIQNHTLVETLKRVEKVYILPWVIARGKIATKQEVMERWARLICYPEQAKKLIALLESLAECSLLELGGLLLVDEELFAADQKSLKLSQNIIKLAKSYFYKGSKGYSPKELYSFMQKELSYHWVEIQESLIERVLTKARGFKFTLVDSKLQVLAYRRRT